MSNHVYKTIELVGSSALGSDDAVKTAVTGVAQDCSNPSFTCPSTFQTIMSVVKYHSAKSRSFGLPCG